MLLMWQRVSHNRGGFQLWLILVGMVFSTLFLLTSRCYFKLKGRKIQLFNNDSSVF
jgi:hypothetical protein